MGSDNVCFILFIAFLAYTNAAKADMEPTCYSRYEYDVNLLTKLIHLEVEFKTVLTTVNGLAETMETRLKTFEETITRIQQNMEGTLLTYDGKFKEQAKTAANKIEESFEHNKHAIEGYFTQITDQMAAMNLTLLNVTNREIHGPVVFYAHTVRDTSPSTGDTVVYTDTVFDTTGSYDSGTGIFTVPVDGTYIFTVSMCVPSRSSDGLSLRIVTKDIILASGRTGDQTYTTTGSMTGAAVLERGSQVWVHCSDSGPMIDNSDCKNIFTAVSVTGN